MKQRFPWLLAAALAVAGCGGGGSGADIAPASPGAAGGGAFQGAGAGTGSAGDGGSGSSGSGSSGSGSTGSGSTGSGGGSGTSAGGSGSGSGGSAGSAGSAGSGSSAGGDTGSGVAGGPGGVGSGGTGVDGTGVASVGGGDTGVGSGGTGVSSASSSVGIGSVDGFGSIIVNGIRYDISQAQLSLGDATELKLGMTVRVIGSVSIEQATGTASRVISAPELRGRIAGLDRAARRFSLLTVAVSTDSSTVFEGAADLGALADGQAVQVYGLPGSDGELRATRIEVLAAEKLPVVSGAVRDLNREQRRFRIGALVIDYTSATVDMGGTESGLAEGTVVRVPGAGLADGVFVATAVQGWQAPAAHEGQTLNLGGVISDFTGPRSFRLQGVTVDASAAQITGAGGTALGNGVRVELGGQMRNGVLVATRVKIRNTPGTAATPATFTAEGPIGQFRSVADFKVQEQAIDASGPHVVFGNGSAQQLRPGAKVKVAGSRVVAGALIADRVDFQR